MEDIRRTTWYFINKTPVNDGISYQPQLVSLPDFSTINSMTNTLAAVTISKKTPFPLGSPLWWQIVAPSQQCEVTSCLHRGWHSACVSLFLFASVQPSFQAIHKARHFARVHPGPTNLHTNQGEAQALLSIVPCCPPHVPIPSLSYPTLCRRQVPSGKLCDPIVHWHFDTRVLFHCVVEQQHHVVWVLSAQKTLISPRPRPCQKMVAGGPQKKNSQGITASLGTVRFEPSQLLYKLGPYQL